MKKYFGLGMLLVVFTNGILSQSIDSLDVNNMNGFIWADGYLFNDSINATSGLEVPKGTGQNIVYAASTWFGGVDISDSSLHISAHQFNRFPDKFDAGPLASNYSSIGYKKYQRLWKITKAEIDNHRQNYSSPNYILPSIIADWPAHGDVNNGEAYNLAPYIDYNSNNTYDPINGDYPCIKGDEALYIIYNTHRIINSSLLPLEVHLMAYAYNTTGAVNNAIFLEYKILNRSTKTYADFLVGNYYDFDVGCSNDDYIGCDSNLNLFYAYNGDNFDEDCSGQFGYKVNPGAAGVVFLNVKMSSFISFNRVGIGSAYAQDPSSSLQYYNYMKSIWRTGEHMVIGGVGHPFDPNASTTKTNFMFPGDPLDTNTWTEISAHNSGGDRRGLGSVLFPVFAPNDRLEIDLAVVHARDTSKNNLENVAVLKSAVSQVQSFYNSTNTYCSYFATGIANGANDASKSILIYPNPASNSIYFKVERGVIEQIEFYNNLGTRVLSEYQLNTGLTSIDISVLSKGVYFARVMVDGEVQVQKVMIE